MAAGLLAALSFPMPTFAADLIGCASIIDGDTIEIHGQRIRLLGIDAPEPRSGGRSANDNFLLLINRISLFSSPTGMLVTLSCSPIH